MKGGEKVHFFTPLLFETTKTAEVFAQRTSAVFCTAIGGLLYPKGISSAVGLEVTTN